MKIRRNSIRKIGIIVLSNLGDNILLTPAVCNLVEYFNEASFYVFVPSGSEEVFSFLPNLEEIVPYSREENGRWYLIKALRERKLDLVVDFRCTLVPWLSGARYKPTFFFKEFFISKRNLHEADRNIAMLKKVLGIPVRRCNLTFQVKGEDKVWIKEVFKDYSISKEEKKIALAIGANWDKKRWPIDKFAKLADDLSMNRKCRFFLIGSREDERDLASDFIKLSNVNTVNLVGRTTLGRLAALLESIDLLISNDTGVLHLASAMQAPTVAIFGPGNWKRYGPYGNKYIIVHLDLPCMPCNRNYCKYGDFRCIKDIPVEMVERACYEIWD
ncbi:MAG: glycosyltransferase family 9 protein [Synergistetes bacterium]|nr:glycosyltransferase family 9 protein [Synergistota bacterium]